MDDIVAFIATQASHQVTQSPRVDNVHAARYFVMELFRLCLITSLASEIALRPAPLQVTLEARWMEFVREAPRLKQVYAITISDLHRYLASESTPSVNPV
ncbi:hypothetical protein AVME950_00425 [Acidovorax sp. SUPP950]|uniref:hypothetical protein n=1 Tax=Acidovorax sp. SUPP950 TaxID=511901 RepID=UPI0023CFA4B9|nr:hypothetical protein [Acidovorax sp. SUPP950]GKS73303.1 hypothetical protein AVME950_00425 [Acidovorax sp. SUPP950]